MQFKVIYCSFNSSITIVNCPSVNVTYWLKRPSIIIIVMKLIIIQLWFALYFFLSLYPVQDGENNYHDSLTAWLNKKIVLFTVSFLIYITV